jgi:hypothetical protein
VIGSLILAVILKIEVIFEIAVCEQIFKARSARPRGQIDSLRLQWKRALILKKRVFLLLLQ